MAKDDDAVRRLLRQHLADPATSWSIGCFGAIAEFHRTPDEPVTIDLDSLTVVTALGALRVAPPRGLKPLAYELPSAFPHRWLHGLNFTLTASRVTQKARETITPLGPDRDAIRPEDREAQLFDLGVGAANISACVRTADPELIALLHDATGTNYLDDQEMLTTVVHASPHRVFLSDAGRLEVYQRIGTVEAGAPEGPHTHLLPKLLAAKRTHQATIALPRGRMPVLTAYPANPMIDPLGHDKPFDPEAADAFAAIVSRWADPQHRAEKARATAALAGGVPPESYAPPRSRAGRLALRVALRQHAAAVGDPEIVAPWRQIFDPTRARAAHGHDAH